MGHPATSGLSDGKMLFLAYFSVILGQKRAIFA
jgi:hypothetical protein